MAVITISRQYGSGGDEIAAHVCQLLDYRLFDRTLMDRLAIEIGLSPGELVDFSDADHQTRSFLDRLFSRRTTIAQIRSWTEDATGVRRPVVEALDEEQAIGLVQGTILAAYKRGDVVIVGRGGQVILRDKPGVVHVRVEAPLNERIRRVQEQEGLLPSQAGMLVADREKATMDYLRRFYDLDPSHTEYYHLVLNSGLLDLETAAELVVAAVRKLESRLSDQQARKRAPVAVPA